MASFNQISFQGGEISPRLRFNENEPLYHMAVESGLNFVVTEQGSAITRCGSKEVGQCQNGDVRLFRLPAIDAPASDIIVEVGDVSIAVWVNDVRTVVDDTPPEWIGTLDRIQTAYDVIGDDAGQANTGRLIMVHPALQPKRLYRDAVDAWQFVDMHTGTVPAAWAPGNYPQTVGIFQNRVWYVGSPVQRTYFWASEAGVLENIDTTTGTDPNDPIEFIGIMEGTPVWAIASSDVFTIGTTINDYQLTAISGGTVTASSAELRRSSTHGASRVQGTAAEEQVVFASRNSSKVQAMNYIREQNNWLSEEISSQAEHLFGSVASPLENDIRRLTFIADADKALWALLGNGKINHCCFDQTTKTTAWTRLDVSGHIVDIAPAFNPDADYGYIAVKRNKVIAGEEFEFTMLEKIAAPRADWKRADGWIEAVTNPNGDVLNLDRYIGKTAVVFSEFGLESEVEVTEQGQTYTIPFYDPQLTYYVGYKMTSTMRTLPPALGKIKQALASSTMRSYEAQLALYRSIRPSVDGERPDDRSTEEIMDTRSLDFSENTEDTGFGTDVVVYRVRGWENKGRINISVDEPFICEIVSIFKEIKVNKV